MQKNTTLESLKGQIVWLVQDMGGSNIWMNEGAEESKLHDFVEKVYRAAVQDCRMALPMEDDGAPDRSNWSAGWGDYRIEALKALENLTKLV